MIYAFGDPHWGHFNIISLTARPFKTADEMNEILIKNYNSIIQSNDEVYFMGDVAYKIDPSQAVGILNRLNSSRKYLLIGNHDHKNLKNPNFVKCFEWVKDYYELSYNKNLYVLSHYPFHSWRSSCHNSIMLHSHTHGKIDNSKVLRFDCGVDNVECSFFPISIVRIESIMKEKKALMKEKEVANVIK